MTDTYCGESAGKKIARAQLYRDMMELSSQGKVPRGRWVTLAGRDAEEVSILRDYIGLRASDVVFVDRHSAGLLAVRRKWPGTTTFLGELSECLSAIDGDVAFVHADFMGPVSPSWRNDVGSALNRVHPHGGVVAATYLRGRESPELRALWEKVLGPGLEVSVMRQVLALMFEGEDDHCLLRHRHYRSASSPMGQVVFARRAMSRSDVVKDQVKRASYWEEVDSDSDALKRAVATCPDTAAKTAALFCIDPVSVPAIRAHWTRGRYRTEFRHRGSSLAEGLRLRHASREPALPLEEGACSTQHFIQLQPATVAMISMAVAPIFENRQQRRARERAERKTAGLRRRQDP